MEKLNVIIYSKDRTCQLDLLLRSIHRFVKDRDQIRFSILFTASNRAYGQGYEKVQTDFPEFTFLDERQTPGNFKTQTLSLVDPGIPLITFLVDDDLFKHTFSLNDPHVRAFEQDRNLLCLSLRLGRHITYCYPMDEETPPPSFHPGEVWTWKGQKGDWGYPMSLDGHIFRTREVGPLLKQVPFQNPNTLESKLAAAPLSHPRMNCYPQSRILNLPVNKVQQVFNNRAGTLDPAEINRKYVHEGLRIRLEPFVGFVNRSPHQELPLEFSKEG